MLSDNKICCLNEDEGANIGAKGSLEYKDIIANFKKTKCSDSFDAWSVYKNKKDWTLEAIKKGKQISLDITGGKCEDCLARVMLSESGGEPKRKNNYGCVGLIQFCPITFKALKTSKDKLLAMDAMQQLDYVRKYFDIHGYGKDKKKFNGPGHIYAMAFLPTPAKQGKDPLICGKLGSNTRLDFNKDGCVSMSDLELEVYRFGSEMGYNVPPPCTPITEKFYSPYRLGVKLDAIPNFQNFLND